MKVCENLTSCNGAQIEVHLEDKNDETFFDRNYSHGEFQDRLRVLINNEGTDTGKNTVIHLLINKQRIAKSMIALDYNEWLAKEKKDWFHDDPSESVLVIHFIGTPSSKSKFVGPTTEELEEIFSDPKNRRRISIMENKKSEHNCQICLEPLTICPFRRASYNHKKMKEVLDTLIN